MKLKIPRNFGWFALGLCVFVVIAADVTTTMFDTTYFSATDTKVSLVGTLTNWAKLTTNSAGGSGSAMVGTVSNNVASAGLLAVDATKTNGIAATLAHMTNAFGLDGVTTKFISGDGTERTPSTVSAANPTATVSGSAVNGSASTFMRSDAAPALSTVGTAGTYGDSTHFPVVTTDANGRVTAVTINLVPAGVSAANPTATVDIAAVNGSAATFMRSDAAPVLSTVLTAVKAFQSYQGTLTHAGTVTLDFNGSQTVNTLVLTGNVTFAASNLATNRTYRLRICNTQATNCTPVFPWPQMAGGAPSTITALTTNILSAECWGSTTNDVIAAFTQLQ